MTLRLPRVLLPQPTADVAGRHADKVARIAAQLRARTSGRPVSFKKKAVSHVVPKRDDKRHTDEKINISDLDAILEIDPVARTRTAEARVTCADVATLAHMEPGSASSMQTSTAWPGSSTSVGD